MAAPAKAQEFKRNGGDIDQARKPGPGIWALDPFRMARDGFRSLLELSQDYDPDD